MYRFHRGGTSKRRASYSGRISRSRVSRASPAADIRSACTLVEEDGRRRSRGKKEEEKKKKKKRLLDRE